MSNGQANEGTRSFSISDDIFRQPGLDIFSQMVYIILKGFASESNFPELSVISKLGRMNDKQTMKALQSLVELKILPHKLFRRMVGDFQDDRLSWAAKGLLIFCKENPHINLHDLLELASESGEDEHSIRKALKELSQYGYLEEYPEWRQIAN
ncbi:hypothetical protein SAMN04487897_11677 [Paenibacillus sp. yr247]|uniref:hypothetical protein n=1 Tax=Paenibacillus sp. yr247 TaxID=1761880 RepID=UPI00088F8EE3|nr:hypothetical protein [Paenibacillus sp. yr247]SDO54375.1 hypothetical protein SAMN04487897_11677 [Paenibacillus sp. yr247]